MSIYQLFPDEKNLFQFDYDTPTSKIDYYHQKWRYQFCQPEFSFFQYFPLQDKNIALLNKNHTMMEKSKGIKSRVEANEGSRHQVSSSSLSCEVPKLILQRTQQLKESLKITYSQGASSTPQDVDFQQTKRLTRLRKRTQKTSQCSIYQPSSQPNHKIVDQYTRLILPLNERAQSFIPPLQPLNECIQSYTPISQLCNEYIQTYTLLSQECNEQVQRYTPQPRLHNEHIQRYIPLPHDESNFLPLYLSNGHPQPYHYHDQQNSRPN